MSEQLRLRGWSRRCEFASELPEWTKARQRYRKNQRTDKERWRGEWIGRRVGRERAAESKGERKRERTVIASGVIQEGRIDALCSGRSNANHAGEKYGSSKIATRRGTVVIIARVLYPSRRDVSLSVREEGWLVTTSYPFYFSRRVEAGFCVFSAAYMLLTRWNFIAFLLAASFRKFMRNAFGSIDHPRSKYYCNIALFAPNVSY